jgi:hypothetical protein
MLNGAYGQTAAPNTLDFPDTALGQTSASEVIKITGGSATYTLKVDSAQKDQFIAWTSGCSDHQLKQSQCIISVPSGGDAPDVNLMIAFAPTQTNPALIRLYSVTTTGMFNIMAVITGTGFAATVYNRENSGCGNAYSDCDLQKTLGFTLLGGIEQSYLSSESDQTNGFLRAATDARVPISENWTEDTWAIIRDMGAPEANSNQNIVSAVGNPDGTITNSSLSTIGYSLDFLVGVGLDSPMRRSRDQYSLGPIIAFGATTPISSAAATVGYVVPGLGTEECTQLQARFASQAAYKQGYSSNLLPGTGGSASTQNTTCLYNNAGGISTPVTTLAFAGIDRSSFLDKWEVGVRTVYRTYTSANQSTCDGSNPCQRGIVDFTVGQDEAITRGELRHFVLKIEGAQPFPYTNGYLFIFGTAAMRLEENSELPPLVLSPSTSTALQSIPTPSVFVEPFMQPDRDFYRIGVGVSIDQIFTALKGKS